MNNCGVPKKTGNKTGERCSCSVGPREPIKRWSVARARPQPYALPSVEVAARRPVELGLKVKAK
jgi:hypothetical protein